MSTLILDSFTADDAHWAQGNIGGEYYPMVRAGGTARLTTSGYNNASGVWNTPLPQLDYWVELDVYIHADAYNAGIFGSAVLGCGVYVQGLNSPVPYWDYSICDIWWYPSDGVLQMAGQGGEQPVPYQNLSGVGYRAVGAHTLKVVVIGSAMTIYLDGVLKATKVIKNSFLTGRYVGIYIYDQTAGVPYPERIALTEFRAGTIADYPPTPFWTGKVGVTEPTT